MTGIERCDIGVSSPLDIEYAYYYVDLPASIASRDSELER